MRTGERDVGVGEDGVLRTTQFLAGFDAQFLREQSPRPLERVVGVPAAPGAPEGTDEQCPTFLPERRLVDELLHQRHELVQVAGAGQRVREQVFRGVPALDQSLCRAERKRRVEEILERRAPPQRACLAEHAGGGRGLVTIELAAGPRRRGPRRPRRRVRRRRG